MSVKEKMSDVAAAAKCGMEKTKATLHEKGEKMTTRDPVRKDVAKHKKELRVGEAELQKQAAYAKSTADKLAKRADTGHHPKKADTGHHPKKADTGHHPTI